MLSEDVKDSVVKAILVATSGTNIAIGLEGIVTHCLATDSVRDAVYAHADNITPEVIEQANKLASEVSRGNFYVALLALGVAGLTLGYMYFSGRKKEE